MRVVLAGVVKNIEKNMRTIIQFITKLKIVVPTLEVCIYENNSTDNSKLVLKDLQEHLSYVDIMMEDYTEEFFLELFPARAYDNKACRMYKIAFARNKLLNMISEKKLSSEDFIIMMDLDINLAPNETVIQDIIQFWNPELHVLFANGVDNQGNYYDTYALRTKEYPFGPEVIGEEFWNNDYMSCLRKPIRELTPVISAFGGLAIYRADVIKDCFYSAGVSNELHEFYSSLQIKDNPKTHYDGCCLGIYLKDDKIFYKNNSGYNYPVVVEHSNFHSAIRKKGYTNMFVCPFLFYYWV